MTMATPSLLAGRRVSLHYLCTAGKNILLNLFFVIVCHLDVVGVALALFPASGLSSFLRALTRVQDCYALDFHKVALDPATTQRILALGLPAGFQNAVLAQKLLSHSCRCQPLIMVKGNLPPQTPTT